MEKIRASDALSVVLPRLLFIDLFFDLLPERSGSRRQLISYAYQQLPSNKPGLRVYLTVDPGLQRAAANSLNEELSRFDRGASGYYNHLSYRHALKEGRKVTEAETKLQAALVALDAQTGEILAMVGGGNSSKSEFNRGGSCQAGVGLAD